MRNSESVSQCHPTFFPNEREGMSEIEFSTPGMCMGMMGDALANLSRIARTRNIAAAVAECREFIRCSHEIVGELSFNRPTCLLLRHGTTCSMTSQSNNPPAHSRSEFVILPLGLESDMTNARTSSGHSSRNTVGTTAKFSPTTTPPTPSFDASTMPMTSGCPVMSSVHFVGDAMAVLSRALHPSSS